MLERRTPGTECYRVAKRFQAEEFLDLRFHAAAAKRRIVDYTFLSKRDSTAKDAYPENIRPTRLPSAPRILQQNKHGFAGDLP
jgi:hypothetical protein